MLTCCSLMLRTVEGLGVKVLTMSTFVLTKC